MSTPGRDAPSRPAGVERWHWGDPEAIVADALAAGRIVAIPTESSYGLAVLPDDADAVDAIFELKGRADDKPLPVVAGRIEQLRALGVRLDAASEAIRRHWPAPLTLIAPLAAPIAASRGRPTLAVRIPAHERLRELLCRLGTAVTATSANRAGGAPITSVRELAEWLAGRDALLIDDGDLPGGAPSTMVALDAGTPIVVREGRYPVAGSFDPP